MAITDDWPKNEGFGGPKWPDSIPGHLDIKPLIWNPDKLDWPAPRYPEVQLTQPRLPMETIVIDIDRVPIKVGEPMVFELVRMGDESGVSGTGKVLTGIVFADNTCVVRWETVDAAQSTVIYDNSVDTVDGKLLTGFQKFIQIHVSSHPTNGSRINFFARDGSKFVWNQPPAPPKDIDKMDVEKAARIIMQAVQKPWFMLPAEKGE